MFSLRLIVLLVVVVLILAISQEVGEEDVFYKDDSKENDADCYNEKAEKIIRSSSDTDYLGMHVQNLRESFDDEPHIIQLEDGFLIGYVNKNMYFYILEEEVLFFIATPGGEVFNTPITEDKTFEEVTTVFGDPCVEGTIVVEEVMSRETALFIAYRFDNFDIVFYKDKVWPFCVVAYSFPFEQRVSIKELR